MYSNQLKKTRLYGIKSIKNSLAKYLDVALPQGLEINLITIYWTERTIKMHLNCIVNDRRNSWVTKGAFN